MTPRERGDVRFDGQVAVVTGAGRGIGRSHALLLASRGARVVVNDLGSTVDGIGSSADPADEVVAEIRTAGGEAVANTSTVASAEGGAAIVQAALDAFGRVDIVVNNAGILSERPMDQLGPELVDRMLEVHLKGSINTIRAAWKPMSDQGYGRIVNTSSLSGWIGAPYQSHYGAAKLGIVGLTRCLALEGQDLGIKVNAIAPGSSTRMTESVSKKVSVSSHSVLGEDGYTQLKVELTSPIVAWLAHRDCPATGELFSTMMGRVARVFIGLTDGYYNPALQPEHVRDRFDEIMSSETYSVPRTSADEFRQILGKINSAPVPST